MKKIKLPVSGMHCTSCEILLEKSIKKIKNVEKVEANEKRGFVEITYENNQPSMKDIEAVIIENGYTLGVAKKLPWITTNVDDYINVFIAAALVFILYIVASANGLSFGNIGNTSSPTLSVAFLIGLTAGISSCMALIGGLVLGISAKWNKEHQNASSWYRFSPHLYFHLGRILGFALLGGVLGFFGSIIHFSSLFLGIMTTFVGIVMLLLGLNLTNLSPRLGNFSLKLPKFLGKNVKGEGTSKTSTFLSGVATFFLPCGFTLAMQVYAVSTGSFVTGALAMALFAIGTVPGLLSIGFVTSILRGSWLKAFFTFTGVIVLILGIFNFNNGYALISISLPTSIETKDINATNLQIQEVRMIQDDSGYNPNAITIDAGKKIRWIITSKNRFSCASQLVVPSLGISKSLQEGENIIEFIAPDSGEIPFSCSMGMYRGKFVINSNGNTSPSTNSNTSPTTNQDQQNRLTGGGGCGGSSGGGCGGGGSGGGGGCAMMGGNRAKTPTTTVNADSTQNNNTAQATETNDTPQTINLTYTSEGLSGNLNVKKGKSYKIVIDVKDTISGCMRYILIPGLDENAQPLDAGTKVVFNIKPTETGRFPITCAMGIPHGFITVE